MKMIKKIAVPVVIIVYVVCKYVLRFCFFIIIIIVILNLSIKY